MLLCGSFAIECVEGRHFKSGWVLDRIPFDWIGPSSSGFLPNSGGLEGSDLLLKSLHPVTGVTIGSLTLGSTLLWPLVLTGGSTLASCSCEKWKRMELSESELSLSLLWLVEPACLDFFLQTRSSTRCISILSVSIV